MIQVVDPGHHYILPQLGTDYTVDLIFVKRSGGAVQYDHQHPGLQTQSVIRALIDRSKYLNSIIPCKETEDAIWALREALYAYEARAYRRKMQKLNRKAPNHDDDYDLKAWRERRSDDIPFGIDKIEELPIGDDGHIFFEVENGS